VIITENELDEWVRGNARDAQGVIVDLVWRLVAASCSKPKERRFPLSDSIGQHGPDGILDVDLAFDPFVPEGRSFWEIGTGLKACVKATSDYNDLVSAIPGATRHESTFVFVTPLSGRRDWENTWKEEAQELWLEEHRARREWRDVRVIDGTKLIDWIHQFPAVELWLEQKTTGLPTLQIETPEQRWNLIRTIGEPPPLTPKLFLTARGDACARLRDVIAGTTVQLKLKTRFPSHVADFVSAYLADLDAENRVDAAGRCLIVSGVDEWNALSSHREKFILIADSELDMSGETGTKLIQKARRNGHAVIFGGPIGGIPDPASVLLRAPQPHEIREALELAGYSEERARTLALKSGGNLGSLLRCLQNLSLMPEWAESTVSAELAIAAMLGSWSEESTADCAIAEELLGKTYGEWIGRMREVSLRSGTPLTMRDGSWRFTARYEGWYALGPKIFDEHLQRLQSVVTYVLAERDPQFELPKDERYASIIHGKVLAHSKLLRKGLAESLALLGSHPRALTSCTRNRAQETAVLAVRKILAEADWERWASLNNLLPLFAEAAPGEFLSAVEAALAQQPCPFDRVFAEEGDGFMGYTYMSGLLWALETLAWDPDHLIRVVICLGELAEIDPGGPWSNRPANSLTTILMPWFPQTCAPVCKRKAAVSALLSEVPEIGWNLVMSLLPDLNRMSSGTRRPAWRDTIPEDWSTGFNRHEFREQVEQYSEMAVAAAKNDRKRLVELIDHIAKLHSTAREQLLDHLGSDPVVNLPECERLNLWNALVDLVTKHRKFFDAVWAMNPEQIARIATVAELLAPNSPTFSHQRLFSERDYDLYEARDNFEDQRHELEFRRQRAVMEVERTGVQSVLAFAVSVESPWRVGIAYGVVAQPEIDVVVLPDLLESEHKQLCLFVSGFVWSRYRNGGLQWVDGIDTSRWSLSQIGQLFSFLPFNTAIWERSARLLGADEGAYWTKTSANPFEADNGLERAIVALTKHGRPIAALKCIHKMLSDKKPFHPEDAVRALLAALESTENKHSMDEYELAEIIKALQHDPATKSNDLLQVEWAYLPILNQNTDSSPKLLEQRLLREPAFFCEVIRLVYKPEKNEHPSEEPTKERAEVAANAYHLLNGWRTPPGFQSGGSYDGEALNRWLEAVKRECAETGHLEIAMTIVGHSLIHAPSDSSGLWIHRSVAAALDARDAEDMRNGFITELYNSRGAHIIDSTGTSERELATKYRAQAEEVESAGYIRLATNLRELAASYEREGDSVASRERFDE
jgi:hypothetical protein